MKLYVFKYSFVTDNQIMASVFLAPCTPPTLVSYLEFWQAHTSPYISILAGMKNT